MDLINQILKNPNVDYLVTHWLDVLIVLILSFYAFKGYKRGLSGEILQVIGLIASLVIAYQFFEMVSVKITQNISGISPNIVTISSYVLIFAVVYSIFYLFRLFVHKIMSITFIAGIEKAGGVIAGIIRGICMLSIVFFLIAMLRMPELTDGIINNSVMGRYIVFVTPNIYDTAFSLFEKVKTFDASRFQMQVNADTRVYDAVQ